MDCAPVIDVGDRKDAARVIIQSEGFFGTGRGGEKAVEAIKTSASE
jgi:hypothetical protein